MNSEKLSFFEKQKIKKFLKKYSFKMYQELPPKLQKNPQVLAKLISEEAGTKVRESSGDFLLELLKTHKKAFNLKVMQNMIDYIMFNQKYEYLKYIDAFEYNYLANKYLINNPRLELDIRKFLSPEVLNATEPINEITLSDYNSEEKIEMFLRREISFSDLDDDARAELVTKHPEYLNLIKEYSIAFEKYIRQNPNYLIEHPEDFFLCDISFKMEYASSHPEFIKFLDERYQMEILRKNFELYKYLSPNSMRILFRETHASGGPLGIEQYFDNYIELLIFILKDDPRYLKYIGHSEDWGLGDDLLDYLREKNLDIKDIITLILRTDILSCKGSLRVSSSSYYQGYEFVGGVDIYSLSQINFISSLSIKEISELMKLDVSYVLPYLFVDLGTKETDRQIVVQRDRAKSLFREVIKNVNYDVYDKIIDKIFSFHQNNFNLKCGLGYSLESLKLLFNKRIIENNTEEDIVKFYDVLYSEEDEKPLFQKLMINAYPKSAKIFASRENLGVYDLNSLEIFEDVIMDNFSEAFINDLISYNVREMQTFLYIVRHPEDLELFKMYYKLLANVMGENIDTIQKCITEYFVNKNLLMIIRDEKLTEEEMQNAIVCLNSDHNLFDINSLVDLKDFDNISREKMISEIEGTRERRDVADLKDIICRYVLGIPYVNDTNVSYGESLYNILRVFNLNENYDYLTPEEKKLMEIVRFIDSINFYGELKKLAYNLANAKNIRAPKVLHQAINKIKTHEIKKLNDRLLTPEKLDKLCEREAQNGKGLVKKLETPEGLPVYFLEGIDLKKEGIAFIYHSMEMAQGRDFMSYESQGSMSTVSTRLGSEMDELNKASENVLLIFSDIGAEEMLVYNEGDANVSHAPKIIRSSFNSGNKVPFTENLDPYRNEVAFYRRTRNHQERGEDLSGRIKPTFICVIDHHDSPGSLKDVRPDIYEYAKKYQIPIVVFKEKVYYHIKYADYERKHGYGR